MLKILKIFVVGIWGKLGGESDVPSRTENGILRQSKKTSGFDSYFSLL
jgi:hypothetical protein